MAAADRTAKTCRLGVIGLPGLEIAQARYLALNELERARCEHRTLASVPISQQVPCELGVKYCLDESDRRFLAYRVYEIPRSRELPVSELRIELQQIEVQLSV